MAMMKETEAGVWYVSNDWHIEDVQNVRPDLDDDDCIDVLFALVDGFDANNGINWEVIEYTAELLYPAPEEVKNDNDE